MTARDLISPIASLVPTSARVATVSADMPAVSVLHRLLDSPSGLLNVAAADGSLLGTIDRDSMLMGLGRLIARRDDSSVIVVECPAQDYSASLIARAVEDADAHLVDLLTAPCDEGKIRVTLRVRHSDPTMTVHSLQRYNFDIIGAYEADTPTDTIDPERLAALRMYLNV